MREPGRPGTDRAGLRHEDTPAALRLQPFVLYSIVINGAKVCDVEENAVLACAEIPKELARRFIDDLDTLNAPYDCNRDEWIYCSALLS